MAALCPRLVSALRPRLVSAANSFGVFINEGLFVPELFVTKKPRKTSAQSPVSAFDVFGNFWWLKGK